MTPQSSAYKLLVRLYRGLLRRVHRHLRVRTRAARRQIRWAWRSFVELLHPRFLASVSPINSETLLNQNASAYTQSNPAVVVDISGKMTSVWQSNSQDSSGWGIYGRQFDANGNPLGDEFLINQQTYLNQTSPAIANDGAGDFVVTWTGNQSGTNEVFARVFNASGTALTNDIKVAGGANAASNADVAMDTNGDFVVTYDSANGIDTAGVFAQQFTIAGRKVGGATLVNTTITNTQTDSSVAMDPVGNYVVSWTDKSGTKPTIRGQRFNSSDDPVGSEFLIGTGSSTTTDSHSSIGVDAGGNFVVAWTSNLGTTSVADIYARRYNAAGSALDANPVLVNTYTTNTQDLASLAMRYDGQYLIGWSSSLQDGSLTGIYAQSFNADGSRDGSEFRVNTTVTNGQTNPSVTWQGTHAAVAWDGNGTGDSKGVFAQFYGTETAPNEAPILILPPTGQTLDEDTSLIFSARNGNSFSFADPDLGTAVGRVTLTAANGTISLGSISGITLISGTGTGDTTVRFSGTEAALIAAMDGLVFTPAANFNGAASIQMMVEDLGNTGTGSAQTTAGTTSLTVAPVADTPSITDAQTYVNLQTNNGLVVSRNPADGSEVGYFQISNISNGKLYLSDGVTPVANGDFLSFAQGSAGLKFTPNAGSTNAGKLTIQASTTNTTAGLDGDKVTANITVYGPPTIVSRNVSTAENTPITLTGGNAIVITDTMATATSTADTVTLTATDGTFFFASTTGLTFATGAGPGNKIVTFAGTVAAINSALYGLTFTPTTYYNGTTTVQIALSNPGTSFSSGAKSASDSFTVSVSAVNTPPVNTLPATQQVLENQQLVLSTATGNAISVSDVDAGTGDLLITLSATNGSLTLAGSTNLSFKAGGTGPSTWIFTGAQSDINAALDGLVYTPSANFVGAASIKITTNDQGHSGSGGSQSATSTLTVNVGSGVEPLAADGAVTQTAAAVNAEQPIIAVDASGKSVIAWAVRGGAGQGVFAQRFDANGNALGSVVQISTDSVSDSTQIALASDDAGDFMVAWNTGSTSIYMRPYDASGNALAAATLVTTKNAGTSASIAAAPGGGYLVAWQGNSNNQIRGIYAQRYNSSGAVNGSTTLLYATGGVDEIDVAANSAGDYAVAWACNSNGAAVRYVLLPAPGHAGSPAAITVATDARATYKDARIGFDASGNVLLTWDDSGTNPDIFSRRFAADGSAIDPSPITFMSLTQISNFEPAMKVGPDGSFLFSWIGPMIHNGPNVVLAQLFHADSTPALQPLQVNAAVSGNPQEVAAAWGPDGAIVGWNVNGPNGRYGVYTQRYAIAGLANPAPVVTVPGQQATGTNAALAFSAGAGNAISVADDADAGADRVTLTATNGTVTLATLAGLTLYTGTGANDATVTFGGTIAAINAALNGLQFTPAAAYSGSAALSITTQNPTSGAGSTPQSDTGTVSIYVAASNQPPVITAPGAQSVDQNGTLLLSADASNALGVSDVDAGSASEQITLSATHGTISLGSAWGITFISGTGSSDTTMTFRGELPDLNAALQNVIFTPATDYSGAAAVQITANDLGHTGTGGAQSATVSVPVTVVPVNQPPVITAPATQTIAKAHQAVFSSAAGTAVTISDVDAAAGAEQLTLSAADGTLTLAQTTGLTFSAGDGSADATMTLTGTLASINAALDGLSFNPGASFTGTTTISLAADDLGNSGPGGAKQAAAAISVTVAQASSIAVVDTTADAVDGNTSSLGTLALNKGADGKISLREAILAANNTPGTNEIVFAIPDSDARHFYYRDDGIANSLSTPVTTTLDDASIVDFDSDYPYAAHSWFSISLNSALPQLQVSNTLVIDGFTQNGASANTLAAGDDAVVRIELTTDSNLGANSGLAVLAGGVGSEIHGMAIGGFAGAGILLDTDADAAIISGDFLGTDVTGSVAHANATAGVEIRSSNVTIGGTDPADRNILSGNSGSGLLVSPAAGTSDADTIENNYIGIDTTGEQLLGNAADGITADGLSNTLITQNVISANGQSGIALTDAGDTGNQITANLIGTDAAGVADAQNLGDGILLDQGASGNEIGGVATGEGNTIAYNGGAGVDVLDAQTTTIRRNEIYGNAGQQIDLGGDGATANTGVVNASLPNDGMNTPVITGAVADGGSLSLSGYVGSATGQSAFANALVDFYWQSGADSQFLGTVTTAADGSFSGTISAAMLSAGDAIVATATDSSGNTSEFSASHVVQVLNQPPVGSPGTELEFAL